MNKTESENVQVNTQDTKVSVPVASASLITSAVVVKTVIFTIAFLVVCYFLTLVYLNVVGAAPTGDAMTHFTTAGNTLMGALIGLLMKTSSEVPNKK